MRGRRTRWGALLAAPLLAGTLAACDPPPPPPVFHVDTTDRAGDVAPGDGECVGWDGGCTLEAAIEESNALGRGEILVPPGEYESFSAVITGDVTVSVDPSGGPTAFATIADDPYFSIDAGATFVLRSIEVEGSVWATGALVLQRSALSSQLIVSDEGTAVVLDSFVGSGIVANGRVVALSSTIVGGEGQRALFFTGGEVTLGGTALLGASGNPACSLEPGDDEVDPVSIAPSFASDASCALSGPGDVNGSPEDDGEPFPNEGSPRIDAIPVGTFGCGTTLVSDIRAFPRPTDGDGDGVAACDIGAWER